MDTVFDYMYSPCYLGTTSKHGDCHARLLTSISYRQRTMERHNKPGNDRVKFVLLGLEE